jgi:uncharacterized membrane protein YfbV (UPF0208 family)
MDDKPYDSQLIYQGIRRSCAPIAATSTRDPQSTLAFALQLPGCYLLQHRFLGPLEMALKVIVFDLKHNLRELHLPITASKSIYRLLASYSYSTQSQIYAVYVDEV